MAQNNGFFKIPREEVLARLPSETANFYKQAGYLDLMAGDLNVAQSLIERDGKVADNIDRDGGGVIVNSKGLQLPSVALMYRIIVPHLIENAPKDREIKRILDSFDTNSEFLEDVIIQDQRIERYALRLRIGGSKKPIILPSRTRESGFIDYEVSGSFNLDDLDDFGFPTVLREDGEFNYWGPNDFNRPIGKELYLGGGGPQGKTATMRYQNSGLILTFRPKGDKQDTVGVRGVKVE